MTNVNCVDMSKWGGPLTEDEARCMWENGVRHLIVGTGHPNGAGLWARQQASTWLSLYEGKGGTCDAYIYLYMAGEAVAQVNNGVNTLEGLTIRKWWLDVEDVDSPHLTEKEREIFIDKCIARVNWLGLKFGIYTGSWWMRAYMPNTTKYHIYPLWNSYYDGDPDIDGLPYNGWTYLDVEIEQFQGTTDFCGQSVDLNWAYKLESGDDMQDNRLRYAEALRRALEWLANHSDLELLEDAVILLNENGIPLGGWEANLKSK